MKLLMAHMQYKENYGARSWDGNGACPQHWKFKGGDSIVLSRMTPEQAANITRLELSKFVRNKLQEKEFVWCNEASEQFLVDWQIIDAKDIYIIWDNPKDPEGDAVSQLIGVPGYDYAGPIVNDDGKRGYYFTIDLDALAQVKTEVAK